MNRIPQRAWFLSLVSLLAMACIVGCASPREREMKRTMRDYQRIGKIARAYAKEQETQMVTAARAFYKTEKRWPFSADELGVFAGKHRIEFNSFAFLRLTFAAMTDGSAQVSYEVDCSRFDTYEFHYQCPGTVRITVR